MVSSGVSEASGLITLCPLIGLEYFSLIRVLYWGFEKKIFSNWNQNILLQDKS
jgi:hypothetical protein